MAQTARRSGKLKLDKQHGFYVSIVNNQIDRDNYDKELKRLEAEKQMKKPERLTRRHSFSDVNAKDSVSCSPRFEMAKSTVFAGPSQNCSPSPMVASSASSKSQSQQQHPRTKHCRSKPELQRYVLPHLRSPPQPPNQCAAIPSSAPSSGLRKEPPKASPAVLDVQPKQSFKFNIVQPLFKLEFEDEFGNLRDVVVLKNDDPAVLAHQLSLRYSLSNAFENALVEKLQTEMDAFLSQGFAS